MSRAQERLHALVRKIVRFEMAKSPRSKLVQADGTALLSVLILRRDRKRSARAKR